MATQNPIEQEGTYPLPEAQLDRFLLHLEVDYPNEESELAILRLNRGEAQGEWQQFEEKISQETIFKARQEVLSIHMAEAIERYIVRLVMATRQPNTYSQKLANWVEMGVSPRATIALDRAARAHAWLAGRDFVSPEDVHQVIYPVLRHRLLLTYQAQAEGVTGNAVIEELLNTVASA
jgi:MoxR-like ATPase